MAQGGPKRAGDLDEDRWMHDSSRDFERNPIGWFLGVVSNLLCALAIEKNAMPDLEIKKTPNSIAMISCAVAVLSKNSFYRLPLE